MRRHGRRGLSVLEVLVSAALLLCIFGMLNGQLIPAMTIWEVNQTRAALEQDALVSLRHIERELHHAVSSSVTVLSSTPPAISFMTVQSSTSTGTAGQYDPLTGNPLWQSFVIYYLDSTNGVLYRKLWPNTALTVQNPVLTYTFPTTTAAALTTADLTSVCTTTNGTESHVTYDVSGFTVSVDTNNLVEMTLSFSETVMGQTLYVSRSTGVQPGE